MSDPALPFLLRAQIFTLDPGLPIWVGRVVNWPVTVDTARNTVVPVDTDPGLLIATPFAVPVAGVLAAVGTPRGDGPLGLYFNLYDEFTLSGPRVIGTVTRIEAIEPALSSSEEPAARTIDHPLTWDDICGDSKRVAAEEELVVTIEVAEILPLSDRDRAYLEQQRAEAAAHCRVEASLPDLIRYLGPARSGEIGSIPLRRAENHWVIDPEAEPVEFEFSQAMILHDDPPTIQAVPSSLPRCGHDHRMRAFGYLPPRTRPGLTPSLDHREYAQAQRDFHAAHNPTPPAG